MQTKRQRKAASRRFNFLIDAAVAHVGLPRNEYVASDHLVHCLGHLLPDSVSHMNVETRADILEAATIQLFDQSRPLAAVPLAYFLANPLTDTLHPPPPTTTLLATLVDWLIDPDFRVSSPETRGSARYA